MQIRVLGPVDVCTGDGRVLTLPRRQERLLLAVLALRLGQTVALDPLCKLLWDDNPPERAYQTVRIYVARIRSLLDQAGGAEDCVAVVSHQGGYLLKADPGRVDAHRFRQLLDAAIGTTDLAERDRLLRDALALWRGPALHRAAGSPLRERLCTDLEELRLQATEASMATGLDLGRHAELLPQLAQLNAERPIRERLVELHMLALYRDGRTVEALDAYQVARTHLVDEFGVDPGAELQRLHRAILRGDPLPAARSPAPPHRWSSGRVVPAQLPAALAGFTGRAEHMDRLDELVRAGTTAVVISAIAGTAGVGKTTLAVHWAHRVRDQFPDGQLYVDLRGFDPVAAPTPPEEVVRRFVIALGVPPQRVPTEPDARIDLYRSLLADRRVLVVLDNARGPEQVRPLLPGAPGCLTLITSRTRLTGLVATHGAYPLALNLLTPDEAVDLLAARLGKDRLAAEPEVVSDLIELCARLPLALATAAARAATQPGLPLAALAGQLRAAHGALDAVTGDDTATNIRAVFACSYRALSAESARLFRLLGLHPGPDISAWAAASLAGTPLEQVRPLLTELIGAHLVTEPAPGRYACHDLLRAYSGELVAVEETEADRRAALHRMFDHYLHTADAADRRLHSQRDAAALPKAQSGVTPEELGDNDVVSWLAAEWQVLVSVVHHAEAERFGDHVWRLAWALAYFLEWQGHWDTGVAMQEAALRATRRLGNRGEEARAHRGIARVQALSGRYEDAAIHYRQALELCDVLGDRIGQAHTHYNLSRLLVLQAQWAEGIEQSRRSLELYVALGHTVGEGNALNAIGYCYTRCGDHRQALAYCRRALTLLEKLGNRNGQAGALDSIGLAHHHLDEYAEATACFQRAVVMCRQNGDRLGEALTLTHAGDTDRATGDVAAARARWRGALDILDDLDHPEADAVRARLRDLGDSYRRTAVT